ncbi:MAG: DEAD/DEAH box helicase family protein [Burkholderiales bacterium]|nr:DEAD/DEAH box helicase family protein [Burkholderiales bacterium]
MNYRFLKDQFIETRKKQAAQHGRDLTNMDYQVSEIMFETAIQAISNVKTGNRQTCMQAVSLGTGLGKSTSAYALIATFAKNDPEFSTAYVVPTIKMAIEAQNGIEALLGEGTTTLWSSHHKHKGVDTKKAFEELGFVPTRTVEKADLPLSEIVIVTHGQLLREFKTGMDEGTLCFLGKPRSVVFIDEHPDLVQIVDASAEYLQRFHDLIVKRNPKHLWLPIISKVVWQMSEIARSEPNGFLPTELLSQEEGMLFDDDGGLGLWDMTDEESSDDARYDELRGMQDAIAFLKAASKGNSFYSSKDWTFFAYQLHFDSNYSGFVLLDATSDLTGLVSLHSKVKSVEVPTVSYENLSLFHIDMPKRFKRIDDVISVAATGREYGTFIEQTVLANTKKGDEVLVVVHKKVLTQELIGMSEDLENSLDWEGRKVNTQNWGAGVGLNKFKDKTHVFLFGEYHLPRAITISQTHAWSQKRLSDDDLLLAESVRKFGDLYSPRGDYYSIHEGHVLRWNKQLAMRGAARNVDGEGKCHPMKLFMTMDLSRLILNLELLFPGAPPPSSANLPQLKGIKEPKGRQALINLAMNSMRSCIGADEIQIRTGIPSRNLSREYDAVKDMMKLYGWSIKSAQELRKPGRMNYLVHDERMMLSLLKAA